MEEENTKNSDVSFIHSKLYSENVLVTLVRLTKIEPSRMLESYNMR